MKIKMKIRWSFAVAALVLSLAFLGACGAVQADSVAEYELAFADDGSLIRPGGWREWIYVGTPLTPHDLNGGMAGFPEFHSVYIDPESWEVWKKTGTFREGTIIAKELALVGAKVASSGAGYFMGDLAGFEIAYKSTKRYPEANGGWAYFTFGHKPEPYDDRTPPQPAANCAACHTANAADDNVFTQHYPVLVEAKGTGEAGAGPAGH